MKTPFVLVPMLLTVCSTLQAQEPARADQVIEQALAPYDKASSSAKVPDQPASVPGPRSIEQPGLPLSVYRGGVVSPPAPVLTRQLTPHTLPSGEPLARELTYPRPPAVILPEKPRLRLPGPDVETPLAVPVLGSRQEDRASVGDPARAASRSLTLGARMPSRAAPVPFEQVSIPDPFELRRIIELASPPAEELPPPLTMPLTPPKRLEEKPAEQ